MATTGAVKSSLIGIYVGNTLQAYSRSKSLTINGTVIDVTTDSSSGYRNILMSTKSGSCTIDGILALDSTANADKLADYLLAGTRILIKFTTKVAGDKYWYFYAYVASVTITGGGVDEPTTYSATMEIDGTITSLS